MRLLALFLLLLMTSHSIACESVDMDLTGVYKSSGEGGQLVFLDLFFQHGAFVFNAKTATGAELVGNWTYAECQLKLEYDSDGKAQSRVFKVETLTDAVLALKDPDGDKIMEFVREPTR